MSASMSASMSAPPAIAVERLVKTFRSTTAVAGISFALAPGSVTALLGGNGAGKTTTIATIMGLVEPTAGRVTVLGAAMPRELTVRQNLRVFGELYGVPDVAGRIAELAGELDLDALIDRETGKLSSGQRTR